MADKQGRTYDRTKLVKIGFVVLIFVVIGGIWFAKNNYIPNLKEAQTETNNKQDETEVKESTPSQEQQVTNNEDFALDVVDKLDLEKLKSYGLPIVIDFGSDSCIPCKEMAPVLKELNQELKGKSIIRFVDVWKYQSLANGYPISVIPTQVFFDKDGKPYTPSDPEKMQMLMYGDEETNEHVFTTHEGPFTKEEFLVALKEMGLSD